LGVHATAAWSQTLFVPPSVDLLGLNLTVQSWTLGSPSLLPAETSNGVALVIGP